MSKNILICESPGKVKKLTEYAGNDYTVIACYGHVRELSKSGQLGMGFTFDAQNQRIFCDYISRSPNSKKVLNRLTQAVKNSNRVVLATDEDREGEFISWHLWDALNLKNQDVEVVRVTFTEITKKAVQTALAHPRQIDLNLVHAAEARSCLDRLVGFSLSPMLWKTETGAKSAGRCQSAALHILAERERIINNLKPQDYWLIRSHYVGGYIGNLVDERGQRAEGGGQKDDYKEITLHSSSLTAKHSEAKRLEPGESQKYNNAVYAHGDASAEFCENNVNKEISTSDYCSNSKGEEELNPLPSALCSSRLREYLARKSKRLILSMELLIFHIKLRILRRKR